MGIIDDDCADGAAVVVSFASMLDIVWVCWKMGGGSARNSAWVCAMVDVRCR